MKKVLIFCLAIFMVCLNVYLVYAQLTAGASPTTVNVNSTTRSRAITFPFKTRNLMINNQDSTDYVYVDLTSSTNTNDIGRCTMIAAGDELALYDFVTEGISILWSSQFTGGEASPISVLATY